MNNNTPNSRIGGQEAGGWGTPNAAASAQPSTPQQTIQLDPPGASNLTSNPAANVQANGLNIVADASDRLPEGAPAAAIAAAVSEVANSESAGRLLRAPSVTARDSEGRTITRSRSSSSIAPGAEKSQSTSAQVQASLSRESSDNAPKSTAAAVARHGIAGSVDLTGQTAVLRQTSAGASTESTSVPSSPRKTSHGIDVSSHGSHAHVSGSHAGHGNGAHPEALSHQSQSLSQLASKPTSAAVAKHLASSQSASYMVTGGKVPRTVPQANPFRPRRSSSYQVGPTLCDIDFRQLSSAFGESFQAKKRRIRATSPFAAGVPETKWDLVSVIFKGGDDLRQEVLAMQFITAFDRIFRAARLPLYLKPYSVVITSSDSGLIETIPDAVSIDSLKKRLFPNWTCLTDFYAAYFGGAELAHIIEGKEAFDEKYPMDCGVVTYQTALRNFVESMAGYSVVSFLLQVRDQEALQLLFCDETICC